MRTDGIVRFIVRYGWSRIALGLALVHVAVFLVTVFSRPPLPLPSTEPCPPEVECIDPWDFFGVYLAGRYFHDPGLNMLGFADFPALLLGDRVTNLLSQTLHTSRVTQSYVNATVWLLLGTLQWWLIGTLLNAWRRKGRHNTSLQPTAEKRGG